MDNVIVLGNGFNIDLGLKTTFKAFRESFEFRSIADIPLNKRQPMITINGIHADAYNFIWGTF